MPRPVPWLPASLLVAALALAGTSYAAGPGGENAVDLSAYPTRSEMTAAVQQAVPSAATATPPATALDGAPGASMLYARADHTHAARVQRVAMWTAADGTLTWTFARPIIVATNQTPPLAYMVEDQGSPVVVQVIGRTFTTAGGQDTHTAVTVRAQRSRTLPATLTLLSSLINFDIFGGAAADVRVNLWAADPTQ